MTPAQHKAFGVGIRALHATAAALNDGEDREQIVKQLHSIAGGLIVLHSETNPVRQLFQMLPQWCPDCLLEGYPVRWTEHGAQATCPRCGGRVRL